MHRRPSSSLSFTIFKHEYLRGQQADRNQILSEASFGRGKGSIGFGADQFRTLVSMSTDSSHSYNWKNGVITFSRMFLIGSFFILTGNNDRHETWMSSKFGRIRPWTTELAALERRPIMDKTILSHFLRYFQLDPFHICR